MGPGGSNWPAQGSQLSPKRCRRNGHWELKVAKCVFGTKEKTSSGCPRRVTKQIVGQPRLFKNVKKQEMQESTSKLVASLLDFHEMSKSDVVNLCRISLLQETSAFISFLVHVSGRGGKPKVDASQMPPRCLPTSSCMIPPPRFLLHDSSFMMSPP